MTSTDTGRMRTEQIAVYLEDLDQMGIVHYTRYPDLLERALVGHLSASGVVFPDGLLSPAQTYESMREFTISYQAPIAHVGPLDVHFRVAKLGTTSLVLDFRFQRGETVHAHGRRVSVKVDSSTGRPAPWSRELQEFLLTETDESQ